MTNLKAWLSGLIAITLIAACATTPEPESEAEISEAELMKTLQALLGSSADASKALADEAIWASDDVGNLTHVQSGGICPAEWDQFTLAKPTIFKRDGSDVGCNYQSQLLQSSFTFYFYRNAAPITEEIGQIMAGIQSRVPTGKSVTDDVTLPALDGNVPYEYGMIESTSSAGIITRDGVFITDDSGWRLKLRVTYPSSRAEEIELLVGYMLRGQMDQINPNGAVTVPVAQPGDEAKTKT